MHWCSAPPISTKSSTASRPSACSSCAFSATVWRMRRNRDGGETVRRKSMSDPNAAVFESPEALQEYIARSTARLRARWQERILFIRRGMAHLQALLRVAEAIYDEDMEQELNGKIADAQEELRRLEEAVRTGSVPVEEPAAVPFPA